MADLNYLSRAHGEQGAWSLSAFEATSCKCLLNYGTNMLVNTNTVCQTNVAHGALNGPVHLTIFISDDCVPRSSAWEIMARTAGKPVAHSNALRPNLSTAVTLSTPELRIICTTFRYPCSAATINGVFFCENSAIALPWESPPYPTPETFSEQVR